MSSQSVDTAPSPGQVFGAWTILEPAARDARSNKRWWARCACGLRQAVLEYNLVSGRSRGCLRCRRGLPRVND